MTHEKKALAAAAALVVLVGLWALWPRVQTLAAGGDASHQAAEPASAPKTSASVGESDITRPSPRPAPFVATSPAPHRAFAPMPPINTPMRLAYKQIKEQADAGDPVAQCRLAQEIMRCGRLPQMLEGMKDADVRYSKLPRGAEALAHLREVFARDTAVCQDFTPAPEDRPWRLLLQAGLNGNRTAALDFTLGAGLDSSRLVAELDGWEAYKQYAPLLLQQAIAAGDPRAYQVATFHGRMSLYGAHLVPDDPVQMAAYYMAVMPEATPTYRAFLQKQVDSFHLSDADLAKAQLKAAPLIAALQPTPDGEPLAGNNIVGYGKWSEGAQCEH